MAGRLENFDTQFLLTRFKVEQILEGVLLFMSRWRLGQLISKEAKPSNTVLLIRAYVLILREIKVLDG